MSSSDFAEVVLEGDQTLPSSIRENAASLSDRFETMTGLGSRERKISPLQDWCGSPLVLSCREGKNYSTFKKHLAEFPINEVLPEIVQKLHTTDVVCLIAPTGSGKSILTPYIAEHLALLQNTNLTRSPGQKPIDMEKSEEMGYRKTLLVAPNVEHVGSTGRYLKKHFGTSGIRTSTYLSPYEERSCWKLNDVNRRGDGRSTGNLSSPEFVITTYNAAIRVLPYSKLNLLILDEVHEPNDNVQVAMAIALKMLLASPFNEEKRNGTRSLNKLLLMTATLDEKERTKYEEYFTSNNLTFVVLDFSEILNRRKKLTMSCLPGYPLPEMFELSPLADIINMEYASKGYTIDKKVARENQNAFPDRQRHDADLHNRMRDALNCIMELASNNLRWRIREGNANCDMQSIIVILPGLEQVDKMFSATFKLPYFHVAGKPGFHSVRLTSLVKDDESITSECSLKGNWKPEGHLGRIVLTTNRVAAGLTVPNAAYVIDSGLQKMPGEYKRDGLKKLETSLIDKLMIVQRAGRTGRTTDGEYFLPYSVEKVDGMMKKDHGDLLLNRHFDEHHFLYKKLYKLKLLHEPPARMIQELNMSMKIRGLYGETDGRFTTDALLMNNLFNFLPTEFARIVIQGTQLGIAAHVALLVANAISSVKFCRLGMGGSSNYYGPSDTKSAIHLYCEAMDSKHNGRVDSRKLPEKYAEVGDSIAMADLLASFFSLTSLSPFNRSNLDRVSADPSNFWSGEGEGGSFADLYPAFVKDEGRDAIFRFFSHIEAALRSARLISSSVLDPRLNRYLVCRENFCLNDGGRALLSALLTMHSSRVCELEWKRVAQMEPQTFYKIYRVKSQGKHAERLFPESSYSHPKMEEDDGENGDQSRKNENDDKSRKKKKGKKPRMKENGDKKICGRYTEMFERGGKYTGLIDPITLKQMSYFLNINGDRILRNDSVECSLLLKLNASWGKGGIKIRMNNSTGQDVDNVRFVLERGLQWLTHTDNKNFIKNLEKFIINVWKVCDGR